jgi:hypothetical protein
MVYQIDSNPTNALPAADYTAAGGSWQFTLSTTDCPHVGTAYLLTVYAGDSSGNFNHDSISFTRTS